MLKKMMLLATAVAAVLAFAIPASASAAEWTHNEEPLTENANVEFNGSASFLNAEGTGIACSTAFAKVTLEPGDMGTVTAFGAVAPTVNCPTTGLLKTLGCQVKEGGITPEGLPWTIDVNANDFTITGVKITTDLENCILGSVTIEGNVTATPDSTNPIHNVTLSGTLSSSLGGSVSVGGTLDASPSGTYGIG